VTTPVYPSVHYDTGQTFVAENGQTQTVVAVYEEDDDGLYLVQSEDGTVGVRNEPDVLCYSWRKCQSE
jgi:hypothetical protein